MSDGLPAPITEQARTVGQVWGVFLPLALGVLAMVVLLVGFVVIRYRRRGDGLPAQNQYRIKLELVYTVVPLLVVLGLFGLTVVTLPDVESTGPDPDLQVEVVGFQWQWQFSYPESGVVVRGTDSTEPVLTLPEGADVRFEISSADVIHSFWVPGFRFKRDAIPGRTTAFDVTITGDPGDYPGGVCAEFCGLDHDKMRFSVRILPADEFDAWLVDQEEGA
ncbi:MAG: cytochrome c oxidase subunit II [Acidimicrobiales bacterium]